MEAAEASYHRLHSARQGPHLTQGLVQQRWEHTVRVEQPGPEVQRVLHVELPRLEVQKLLHVELPRLEVHEVLQVVGVEAQAEDSRDPSSLREQLCSL